VVAAGPTRGTLTPDLLKRVYGVHAVLLENPVDGRPVISFSPANPGA
jgi:iron complex transport system ATP-binding protein